MSIPEHPSESGPGQPDQPYEQVSPTTQVFAEYIAAGRIDPSEAPSNEDVREIDNLYVEMFTVIKSLVYKYLSEHGELPPLTGLRPELQLVQPRGSNAGV